jgi:hypothetical protein
MTLILQEHSQAQLLAIQDAMMPYFKNGWIWSTALDERNNRVVIGLNLDNRSPEMDAFVTDMAVQYGTAVAFEKGFPVEFTVGEVDKVDNLCMSTEQPWWLVGVVFVFVLACLCVMLWHRRRVWMTTGVICGFVAPFLPRRMQPLALWTLRKTRSIIFLRPILRMRFQRSILSPVTYIMQTPWLSISDLLIRMPWLKRSVICLRRSIKERQWL